MQEQMISPNPEQLVADIIQELHHIMKEFVKKISIMM